MLTAVKSPGIAFDESSPADAYAPVRERIGAIQAK